MQTKVKCVLIILWGYIMCGCDLSLEQLVPKKEEETNTIIVNQEEPIVKTQMNSFQDIRFVFSDKITKEGTVYVELENGVKVRLYVYGVSENESLATVKKIDEKTIKMQMKMPEKFLEVQKINIEDFGLANGKTGKISVSPTSFKKTYFGKYNPLKGGVEIYEQNPYIEGVSATPYIPQEVYIKNKKIKLLTTNGVVEYNVFYDNSSKTFVVQDIVPYALNIVLEMTDLIIDGKIAILLPPVPETYWNLIIKESTNCCYTTYLKTYVPELKKIYVKKKGVSIPKFNVYRNYLQIISVFQENNVIWANNYNSERIFNFVKITNQGTVPGKVFSTIKVHALNGAEKTTVCISNTSITNFYLGNTFMDKVLNGTKLFDEKYVTVVADNIKYEFFAGTNISLKVERKDAFSASYPYYENLNVAWTNSKFNIVRGLDYLKVWLMPENLYSFLFITVNNPSSYEIYPLPLPAPFVEGLNCGGLTQLINTTNGWYSNGVSIYKYWDQNGLLCLPEKPPYNFPNYVSIEE